jgi:hypothetical protein
MQGPTGPTGQQYQKSPTGPAMSPPPTPTPKPATSTVSWYPNGGFNIFDTATRDYLMTNLLSFDLDSTVPTSTMNGTYTALNYDSQGDGGSTIADTVKKLVNPGVSGVAFLSKEWSDYLLKKTPQPNSNDIVYVASDSAIAHQLSGQGMVAFY